MSIANFDTERYKVVPKDAVVLDMTQAPFANDLEAWVVNLRSKSGTIARLWVADQIEAQTKPARIPEPGLWGVVEASTKAVDRREWVRVRDDLWIADGAPLRDAFWDDLENPTLVRPGIE